MAILSKKTPILCIILYKISLRGALALKNAMLYYYTIPKNHFITYITSFYNTSHIYNSILIKILFFNLSLLFLFNKYIFSDPLFLGFPTVFFFPQPPSTFSTGSSHRTTHTDPSTEPHTATHTDPSTEPHTATHTNPSTEPHTQTHHQSQQRPPHPPPKPPIRITPPI